MGIFKIQYRHNQIFITVMAIIEPAQSGSNISIPRLSTRWILLKTGIILKIGKHKPMIKLFQLLTPDVNLSRNWKSHFATSILQTLF
jgi:hypothetical protein